ncbi:MAG: aspartate-semialdehyde dehydrogenase [Actinomycetota bacterium]|nr:aspartate-semialdehyde dehydrogenase [Actinomycetota bacterium]
MKTYREPRVAIVGATGAVGTTMLAILEDRGFPLTDLRLISSARSAGRVIDTKWGSVEVEDLASADARDVDIVLFSAGGARSLAHAPRFVSCGATVIDNSSAFRMEDSVPLVVAQVNDDAIFDHAGIVANPNCTTMVAMMAVAPLHKVAGMRTLIATTYQSVSGSGQTGMAQLASEFDHFAGNIEGLICGRWEEPEGDLYARPIAYNVVPLAGSLTATGYTDEELKLVNETRKILGRDDIAVEPTCVRVPVMVGHGIAASMWFDRPVDLDEAVAVLGSAPGTQLWDDTKVPTPIDSAGIDDVLIGRLRETVGHRGGISLFVVGDNLRKGAALNAVQLAELLVE